MSGSSPPSAKVETTYSLLCEIRDMLKAMNANLRTARELAEANRRTVRTSCRAERGQLLERLERCERDIAELRERG